MMPVKIDLPYVTIRRNRSGAARYYFQRRGQPVVRLPDDPLSPDFMAAYQRAADYRPGGRGARSLAALCDRYMDAPEFSSKSPATRQARARIIATMLAERIDPRFPETFGEEAFDRIGRKHVLVLRDRKADAPNAANERLKVLSQIFKFAVERGHVEANPAALVKRLGVPRGGHRTATDADLSAYMAHHTGGMPARALRLLMAFGMRVSDLRVLGRQHIRGGYLTFETVKSGVLCELPVPTDLLTELQSDAGLVFVRTDAGGAFASDKALSQRISKWFRQAGVPGITAHSVRKWLATRKAEGGATEYELMAWFGWSDPKEARPYVQAASRRRLADRAARLTR